MHCTALHCTALHCTLDVPVEVVQGEAEFLRGQHVRQRDVQRRQSVVLGIIAFAPISISISGSGSGSDNYAG